MGTGPYVGIFRIIMNNKHLIVILLVVLGFALPIKAQSGLKPVTDQLGRQLLVPDDPQRVLALAASITEIVFELGQEHRLKGATRFSDYPPAAAQLPKVGSYVHLDLERIVALKPDLCIAIKDGNPVAVVKRLESLSIPVYAVDPRGLEAVVQTVLEIGKLLKSTDSAEALAQDMRLRINRVKLLVARTERRPRVFFQIGISPIVSAGSNTFIHELIVLAGGQNLAAGPTPYPRYTREQVLALSPEVFIITSMARGKVFERVKAQWRRWTDLPAVRNDRIFLVDSNLFDRPAPRMVAGLEMLVRLIHPELFGEMP